MSGTDSDRPDKRAALAYILAAAERAEMLARQNGYDFTAYLLAMAVAQTVEDLAVEEEEAERGRAE